MRLAVCLSFLFIQRQCGGVDAKAQAGRLRPIREYMSEMRVTFFAAHFHPGHAVTGIRFRNDIFSLMGLPKTGPAAAGIEFGCCIK